MDPNTILATNCAGLVLKDYRQSRHVLLTISGGLQITAYTVERKELDRDLWISCGKLTGKTVQVMKFLEMDVSDLLPFGVYMFRVCGVNAQVWPQTQFYSVSFL